MDQKITTPNTEPHSSRRPDRQHLAIRAAPDDVFAELYAAGFNAWNQLALEPTPADDDPDDLFQFTKVLGGRTIGRLHAGLCYTMVQREAGCCMTGSTLDAAWMSRLADPEGVVCGKAAVSADGAVLIALEPVSCDAADARQCIVRYPSMAAWEAGHDATEFPCHSLVQQIAAYDSGFVILHEDALVWTLGDPRFEDCLGREVSDSSPAEKPGLVHDLANLDERVTKVSAGGFAIAALTDGGSLYLWGAASNGSPSRHQAFGDLVGVPNYVEIDGGKDVQDVAIGESHGIALTTDGCIYVIGANTNGQLGLGKTYGGPAQSWTKLDFERRPGWTVVGVDAGPRSSFIRTQRSN